MQDQVSDTAKSQEVKSRNLSKFVDEDSLKSNKQLIKS